MMASLYHRRLLHDIHEISTKPYPYITFRSHENDINEACLVLTPPELPPIHLTVNFRSRYPLVAPTISIQTLIDHPNVFNDYICATILNTDEGYTPAYTLKGIAIQLLSFFNSEKLEQDHGDGTIDLGEWRKRNEQHLGALPTDTFRCNKCDFPNTRAASSGTQNTLALGVQSLGISGAGSRPDYAPTSIPVSNLKNSKAQLGEMPAEILIRICDCLESEELNMFMRAWDKIGGAEGVVTKHGLIRTRELQCFALKEGFSKTRLGVGVHVAPGGRYGTLESEFDLLSEKAFKDFGIRKSVQGVYFERWLPLAISRRHYQSVKDLLKPALTQIGAGARLSSSESVC